MSDDGNRADRLRRRRQSARSRSEETVEEDTSKTAKPAKREEREETDETDETGGTSKRSVKEVQKPTYMYLPHSVRKDLDRQYAMLKAEYEYEFDESFEKNRHFYPLVVSLGLAELGDADPETIRDRLDDIE